MRKMTLEQAKLQCANLGCLGFTYYGKAETSDLVKVYIKDKFEVKETTVGSGWVSYRPAPLGLGAAPGAAEGGAAGTFSVQDGLIQRRELIPGAAAWAPQVANLSGLAAVALSLVAGALACAAARQRPSAPEFHVVGNRGLFADEPLDDVPLEPVE